MKEPEKQPQNSYQEHFPSTELPAQGIVVGTVEPKPWPAELQNRFHYGVIVPDQD